MLAGTPVLLLREGTERTQGTDARRANLRAAVALAESIRSTLGPRGMDKLLRAESGDVVITNDGATILRSMEVDHPAAKMLSEVAKAQDQECGDGTKSAVILAGELLKRSEELLDERVHPTSIAQGFRRSAEEAVRLLDRLRRPIVGTDVELLRRLAATSMASKGVAEDRDRLAELAVRAVREVSVEENGRTRVDRTAIQRVKRTGTRVADSELLEGHVLEQHPARDDMPKRVDGARLALLTAPLEVPKTGYTAEIRINDTAKVQAFLDAEGQQLESMARAIVTAGANVVFVEKGIDDRVAESLTRAGVFGVARVPRKDLELLAKASGARLVDRAHDLAPDDLGRAGRVEERAFGEERSTVVTDCPNARAVSLVLRGGAPHVVDEVDRSLEDALRSVALALEDGYVVTGAGAIEVELALRLRSFAATLSGREQLAAAAFAEALEVIPTTLAENAGLDVIETLVELRRRHALGDRDYGVDVLHGRIGDMRHAAVEPARVRQQMVESATDVAVLLLRIDEVIAAKHRSGAPATPGGGPE